MIILEGPDGGGKTTLLKQLREQYPSIPVHARASSSGPDGGPVSDLYDWAHRDMYSWPKQQLQFYDRHPLVSEYIYGPIIRGTIDKRFHNTPLRRILMRRALTVLCLPPLDAVRASVSASRDMTGVHTHIDAIWTLYASLRAIWPTSVSLALYDYTRHDPEHLFPYINHHRTYWSVTK